MHSLSNLSFLRRYIGLTQTRQRSNRESDDSITNSIECYACTQVGVPGFHSTSCDWVYQPEWEALAGSSLVPAQTRPGNNRNRTRHPSGPFGIILDPRSILVQKWNRVFVVARGVSLTVDPLFFYALSLIVVNGGVPCMNVDTWFAMMVTILRTCVDAVHLIYLWFQFRLAYVSKESLVVGCGKLVWDARAIASHYVRSLKGFWLDVFVILPIPQAVFWLVVPKYLKEDKVGVIMTILLLIFLFQFLPKLYHSFCLMSKMRKVTGYIFGTVWWGFGINLIAYLITSHVIGGCWYVLATRSVASCFRQQCERSEHCNLSLSCSKACNPLSSSNELLKYSCDGNVTLLRNSICLDDSGPFEYGFYAEALPVISSNSLATRSLYPVFWGLLNLSSFGNELEPMSDSIQLIFCIFITLAGLSLFTLLVGNIQVYLQVVLARTENMQLRRKEIGWWMRRRQLPFNLRQRVRHYERHRWLFTGGQEEMEWIEELPEGLRRDIKRYLCIELIKKVPLFQQLDDLILDNICDRIKSFILSKDEKIIREGDPVQRMVFLVRGRVKRSQHLSKGMIATSIVEPGGFLGDELLSWCIRYPLIDQLPTASATFVCLESTEVFGLDANNLRYITRNFRYAFASQRLKRTTRYYSSNWRTWAVVIIQLAWQRYKKRTRDSVNPVTVDGGTEGRIRQYAAMFMSIRPHDHLE